MRIHDEAIHKKNRDEEDHDWGSSEWWMLVFVLSDIFSFHVQFHAITPTLSDLWQEYEDYEHEDERY